MSTQSIQAPIRLRSENQQRGHSHWVVRHRKTAKMRADIEMVLTQLERPPRIVGSMPNLYDVTIARIAPQPLDWDNMAGAAKTVVDCVAAWLGIDDRDECLRVRYEQWRCEPRHYAVRITIEDESDQLDRSRVLGAAPKRLVEVLPNELRGRALRDRRLNRRIA